ncbi:MAG: hypothetical protein DI536_19155 [Archangium gephyra]|uniref:Uncharacterized protein n=1 Tax=Archangium gephyra TaxID=48 RepID=A0A2W5V4X6_9BACT|nr:MAG: hypothetical protein DI536_19155 [Archangium gephyra]
MVAVAHECRKPRMSIAKLARGQVKSKWEQPRATPPAAKTAAPASSSFQGANSTSKIALPSSGFSFDDVVRGAKRALFAIIGWRPNDGQGTVVSDPSDVNDGADVSGDRAATAVAQLSSNRLAEYAAVNQLSKDDRASYLALSRELRRPGGDPVAALALQTMLLDGRVTKSPALLTNLNAMLTQPLTPEIELRILLPELIQEVAVPEAMNQTTKNTCVPTVINMQLAMNDPAEYVRLVSGLATPEGRVTTRGGDALVREPGVFIDGTTRSLPQKLMSPAVMELANGKEDYDNAADRHTGLIIDQWGMSPWRADAALESLSGKNHEFKLTMTDGAREHAMNTVDSRLERGDSTLTVLWWGDSLHALLVTGTETRDGVPHVRYQNPWGVVEVMPKAEFESRLFFINYDAKS